MKRATIIASVDEPGEAPQAGAWLAAHRESLAFVSGQLGCGCCVLMWNVEGPEDVMATLPEHLSSSSDFTREAT